MSIFQSKDIHFQLVPPDVHCRNAAERAIRTWKNHFIAGLCSTDPTFPMAEWDCLVRQWELTLNLLRNSRVNPKLLAWAYLFGQFDFNATPLAPPGIKVIVHSKPTNRASWDPRGLVGYYIWPAMHHYRFTTCYIPKTRFEQITDTITFVPTNIPVPELDTATHIQHALADILHLLHNNPRSFPSLTAGDDTYNTLGLVAEILHRSATIPSDLDDTNSSSTFLQSFRHIPSKSVPRVSNNLQHHAQLPTVPCIPTPNTVPQVTKYFVKQCATPPRVQNGITQLGLPTISPPSISPIHLRMQQSTVPDAPPFHTPLKTVTGASATPSNLRANSMPAQALPFLYPSLNHIYNPTTGKRETLDSLRASPNGSDHSSILTASLGTPEFWCTCPICVAAGRFPLLNTQGKLFVQSVVGSFLYYGQTIDHSTMLVVLNEIAAHQAAPTQFIKDKCTRVLDYAATYPHVKLRFTASDMVLHVDSDAAYLVQDNARSRIAGHYILSSHPPPAPQFPHKAPNAPILIDCVTL